MRVGPEEIRAAAVAGRSAAEVLRLPLRQIAWRGSSGSKRGRGVGSSLNFLEHRHYHLGDDIRQIDWRVSARTGQTVLKVFEEEVSPGIDLFVDTSSSMEITPAKKMRTLEALSFLQAAAEADSCPTRIFLSDSTGIMPLDRGQLETGWVATHEGPPDLHRVPWRSSGLRILISDLLYPDEPQHFLRHLAGAMSAILIVAPFDFSEAQPDWESMEVLEDCELGGRKELSADRRVRDDYDRAYQTHFNLWTEACRSVGASFFRLRSDVPLRAALSGQNSPFPVRTV